MIGLDDVGSVRFCLTAGIFGVVTSGDCTLSRLFAWVTPCFDVCFPVTRFLVLELVFFSNFSSRVFLYGDAVSTVAPKAARRLATEQRRTGSGLSISAVMRLCVGCNELPAVRSGWTLYELRTRLRKKKKNKTSDDCFYKVRSASTFGYSVGLPCMTVKLSLKQ